MQEVTLLYLRHAIVSLWYTMNVFDHVLKLFLIFFNVFTSMKLWNVTHVGFWSHVRITCLSYRIGSFSRPSAAADRRIRRRIGYLSAENPPEKITARWISRRILLAVNPCPPPNFLTFLSAFTSTCYLFLYLNACFPPLALLQTAKDQAYLLRNCIE